MTIKATAYKSTEQDNRDIATAKAAIEAEKYVTTQREVDNEASAKDKAQALVNALGESLAGTTATVVDGNFIAAIAGKEPFAIGTDGSYTFTVTISKGMGTPVTLSQKMTITATALAPLFLGITSEDDASADGTTRIIAPSGLPTGQYYSYKISEDENAVPRPYVGDAWSGGTAFGNGNNEVSFEVENGKHIGVAIVDSEGKVVAFTDVVAVAYRQVKPTAKIADWADGGNYFGTTAGTASRNDSVSQPDFSFTGDGTWKTSNEVAIQLADEPAKKI